MKKSFALFFFLSILLPSQAARIKKLNDCSHTSFRKVAQLKLSSELLEPTNSIIHATPNLLTLSSEHEQQFFAQQGGLRDMFTYQEPTTQRAPKSSVLIPAHEQQKQRTAILQITARQLIHETTRAKVSGSNAVGPEQDLQNALNSTQQPKKNHAVITAEVRKQLELNLQNAREALNSALHALKNDKTNIKLQIASRTATRTYNRAYHAIPENRVRHNKLKQERRAQNREQYNAYQRTLRARKKENSLKILSEK